MLQQTQRLVQIGVGGSGLQEGDLWKTKLNIISEWISNFWEKNESMIKIVQKKGKNEKLWEKSRKKGDITKVYQWLCKEQ